MAVAASRVTAATSAVVRIWATISPVAASERGHFGGHRDGRFAFHDRNRPFFGDDDDYPGYCQPEWVNRYGHRVMVEVCS